MSLGDLLPMLRRLTTDDLRDRLHAAFMHKQTLQDRQLVEAIGRVLAERGRQA